MEVKEFWRNLSLHLRVRHRVVATVGNKINVGEKFTVRFTVQNLAHPPSGNRPRIWFRNPELTIRGTEFAKPVDSNTVFLDLPDTLLKDGETSSVDLEFIALKDMDDPWDWYDQEKIAQAWVIGQLDTETFFRVWNFREFKEEIDAP